MQARFGAGDIGMPLKVLVCDDERHIVRLIQVNLERQGYTVVTAFDGKDGLEKVKLEKPDLMVLDVMMPYMDGFEVLKALRREPEYEALPVIMLTAKAQDKDVFEGYHYGADMYLTKPFNPMELVSFVNRIAQSKGDPGGAGSKRHDL
jgi:two-component system alkaline phosphatase synthesis response regulator PhoP/two-component system response regulator VicR